MSDPARSRNLRLTDSVWASLEAIASDRGLEWGGIPSRSEAVRELVKEEAEGPTDVAVEAAARRGFEAFLATEHYPNVMARWDVIARAVLDHKKPPETAGELRGDRIR